MLQHAERAMSACNSPTVIHTKGSRRGGDRSIHGTPYIASAELR
jgi:hypothetical protein